MIHNLKILPAYFEAVIRGDKKAEIRFNDDRGFQKGDTVLLNEILPLVRKDDNGKWFDKYTGRQQQVEITYVTNYEQKPGNVVFCFKLIGNVMEKDDE